MPPVLLIAIKPMIILLIALGLFAISAISILWRMMLSAYHDLPEQVLGSLEDDRPLVDRRTSDRHDRGGR